MGSNRHSLSLTFTTEIGKQYFSTTIKKPKKFFNFFQTTTTFQEKRFIRSSATKIVSHPPAVLSSNTVLFYDEEAAGKGWLLLLCHALLIKGTNYNNHFPGNMILSDPQKYSHSIQLLPLIFLLCSAVIRSFSIMRRLQKKEDGSSYRGDRDYDKGREEDCT